MPQRSRGRRHLFATTVFAKSYAVEHSRLPSNLLQKFTSSSANHPLKRLRSRTKGRICRRLTNRRNWEISRPINPASKVLHGPLVVARLIHPARLNSRGGPDRKMKAGASVLHVL